MPTIGQNMSNRAAAASFEHALNLARREAHADAAVKFSGHLDRLATDVAMVNGSNANPAIRRCELMVRMRGFEDLAKEMGCVGEFYTITAPSKYHAVHSGGGFVAQWNGASPRQTQQYLCGVWAKVRAAISRAGIHVFGFRVVEPHHDGTPHWHMLLFMLPQDVDQVRDILCYHARLEDSEELQSAKALKARFHVEPIDPAKGSATGYIAKYISKNIDGYALDGDTDDETGQSLKDMAKAVNAWASRWRIRQFQQIGGAPVTVWRELRRLPGEGQILPDQDMDNVRFAADVGNWSAYTEFQGGPLVARKHLATQANHVASVGKDATTAVAGSLVEKIGKIRSSIAAVRQDVIAPVVWVGSQQINVMELMLETLGVVQELAQQTAAHTHSNTGTPQNAGAISATGAKSDKLKAKYAPVIG